MRVERPRIHAVLLTVILCHCPLLVGGCGHETASPKTAQATRAVQSDGDPLIGIPRDVPPKSDVLGPLAPFGVPHSSGVILPRANFAFVPGDARSVVYVLDATGSMMSFFDWVCDQLRVSIQDLDPPQSFDIIFFAESHPTQLAPALLFATRQNKREAMEFTHSLRPRGGTDPLPALTKAFGLKPDLIYLVLDPSCFPDKRAVLNLVAEQRLISPIKLNIIAVEGHDPENEMFLKKLAAETDGRYRYYSEKNISEW